MEAVRCVSDARRRGYGSTRFLSNDAVRNAQQSALGTDVVDLMNALKIDKAVLAGFDWGARTAAIVAALWPERCKALVSVSGYLITNLEFNKQPLPPAADNVPQEAPDAFAAAVIEANGY